MNNENISSGKGLTHVKTTLLPGQERVTVVASLPTNPSCDVTANIPIVYLHESGQSCYICYYNGNEIIGLIHLKYGKRMACPDKIFNVNAVFSREAGKRSKWITNPDLLRSTYRIRIRIVGVPSFVEGAPIAV